MQLKENNMKRLEPDLSNVALVPRLTKLQFSMRKFGLSREEAIAKYEREGSDTKVIVESHDLQLETLDKVTELLKPTIIPWGELRKKALLPYSLVIAFGGDNHFLHVGHFLNETPILGINSDPIRSDGALVGFTFDSFEELMRRMHSAKIEQWTRLEVTINDKRIRTLGLSEIYAGEQKRMDMSDYLLEINGITDRHTDSGLLVATGSGSTGWHNGASRFLYPNGIFFPRTQRLAIFLATEPFPGRPNRNRIKSGYLTPDQELTIHSLNDHKGILGIDANPEFSFNRGSVAKIRISDRPLNVVVPNL